MTQPFPIDVDDWDTETVDSLNEQPESQKLEYKFSLFSTDENQSKQDWHDKIEREITAFANANGGIIVFGVTDDGEPAPFEPPEHDISLSITRIIQNSNPVPDIAVPNPIAYPDTSSSRVILPVRIYEASRKPVLTSDSAIYMRINDSKEPMSREQIESLFVERDRRQQSVRQLEMEINRLYDSINGTSTALRVHSDTPPDFHELNIESLKQVLRDNTHLYSKQSTKDVVDRIFDRIRDIESREVFVGRYYGGVIDDYPQTEQKFNRDQRQKLKEEVELLEGDLEELAQLEGLDVKLDIS
ncbi:AlbA family DNA-binding domain-containing protein [Haloarcula salinisoli]|uniref:ATP-binding protein n=1 Tax=Haloarcula salinisoli TaxID=2487746 RepID=A0A8J7YP51_9EURY|nr:ATP-binding protein [Halomicroarcula salinisoli]MBX0304733.1 ATP-binding protein [Halomicroarcula salinisoli]